MKRLCNRENCRHEFELENRFYVKWSMEYYLSSLELVSKVNRAEFNKEFIYVIRYVFINLSQTRENLFSSSAVVLRSE